MDAETSLSDVRAWSKARKDEITQVREMRQRVKDKLNTIEDELVKQREQVNLDSQRRTFKDNIY